MYLFLERERKRESNDTQKTTTNLYNGISVAPPLPKETVFDHRPTTKTTLKPRYIIIITYIYYYVLLLLQLLLCAMQSSYIINYRIVLGILTVAT